MARVALLSFVHISYIVVLVVLAIVKVHIHIVLLLLVASVTCDIATWSEKLLAASQNETRDAGATGL